MMLRAFALMVATLVFGLLFSKCLFTYVEKWGGEGQGEDPQQALRRQPRD